MALLTGNIEHFTFSIPGVGQELKVVGFTGNEKISAPFRYFIELACKDAELDFDSCIGKPALLTLIGDHDNIERYVHGIVQHMHHLRHAQQFTLYKVELVAQLDFLKLRQASRIYQNTTVPDIIQSVFKGANISADHFKLSLNASYEAREYCVQYRETDLQFVARLMQEEGIYYYFEHSKDAHLLIITDNANTPKAIGEPSTVAFHTGTGTVDAEDAVRVFTYSEQVQSGAVTLRDFNFKKPALGLQAQQQARQFANLEVYDYPGGYDAPAGGTKYAQVRLEALQAAADQGRGESNCLRLLPGFRMTLAEHPRKKMNQEFLLTEMTCSAHQPQVLQEVAGGEGTSYNNNFRCIPSNVPFRAPQNIEKPRIDGVQTAIVTGPAGEEIYVDEHGRVKVQFHWDRDGQNDEKSSCWIRVSQLWAGAGWGAMFIPRIAQEVVVDFIEGDPDRPIITGRVFHGTNRPPCKLPDEKTKSTIKSDSTKGGGGSNEWRFEDLKDKEEVYLHGQKDWNIRVENDTKEWIGHDRHLMLLHDQYERIDGDKHQKVNGDHNIKIDGTLSIDVGADVQQKTAQHCAHEVGSEIHLKAGQKVVIEAGAELSLKAGGSFVKLDGSGVTVLGAQLKLNQGGAAGSGAGARPVSPEVGMGVAKEPFGSTQLKDRSADSTDAVRDRLPVVTPIISPALTKTSPPTPKALDCPTTVKFEEHNSAFGFDNYTDASIPWKSVEKGKSDTAKAGISPPKKFANVNFTSSATAKVAVSPATAASDSQVVTVTGVDVGDAEFKAACGGSDLGKMKVKTYSKKTKTVAVRLVHETNYKSTNISDADIKAHLKKVFKQAVLEFTVTRLKEKTVAFDKNGDGKI
ncbi:MAG: type VI secretion system tip protein VgrG, partial [Gammaproteobacteria bacterium]|nr:type VI secretion system tip protein VgrG [Gammaproteobacteria bacterium]